MAPDPGKAYTVTCSLAKSIPDESHLIEIQYAVKRVHQCTFHATELLNLYIRDRLENHGGTGLEHIFSQNWLIQAYYAVSKGRTRSTVDSNLQVVFDKYMHGTFVPPCRSGVSQILMYECINLAAVGSTNVWMHFQKRVLSHVRSCFAITKYEYDKLTKEQRQSRKLELLQVANDLCSSPTETKQSLASYHTWISDQRMKLGIDDAVGCWDDKPLLYHLKSKPQRFIFAMHMMSTTQYNFGKKAFALFPLRRSHIPCHVRFDKKALDDLLKLGCVRSARTQKDQSRVKGVKRKRDDTTLVQEKMAVFNQVFDLRASAVHRRHHFAFSFTTDGVSLHLNMETKAKEKAAFKQNETMPLRGIHSIDALKKLTRSEDVHTIGIDPGKRELIVAVDQDNPKQPSVRYTLAQRQKDMRTRQYADELKRAKPYAVVVAEEDLSQFNSKAPSLAGFAEFAYARRRSMNDLPILQEFYNIVAHRERRRKTRIKMQQSEAKLINRISALHSKKDARKLVLAYGAWGMVAGRPNAAGNKGNPPAIGAGLMKKLALHFIVAPTPEHYTSKTCVKCMGLCGPHSTLKNKNGKEIRGLRVCQHEGCGLLQNRDKTGATNIGLQFVRLLKGQSPIREMSETELKFHRLNVCLECSS